MYGAQDVMAMQLLTQEAYLRASRNLRICIHGDDCPVCQVNRFNAKQEEEKKREAQKQKQDAYKQKCADYLLWFRNKRRELNEKEKTKRTS